MPILQSRLTIPTVSGGASGCGTAGAELAQGLLVRHPLRLTDLAVSSSEAPTVHLAHIRPTWLAVAIASNAGYRAKPIRGTDSKNDFCGGMDESRTNVHIYATEAVVLRHCIARDGSSC